MILAAGLLVLLGLGLFVAGVASGTTALYWATVAVCAAAAVLLLIARRRLPGTPRETHRPVLPDHPATSHRADDDRSRAGRGAGPAPAGPPGGGPPVPPPAATEPGRTDAAPGPTPPGWTAPGAGAAEPAMVPAAGTPEPPAAPPATPPAEPPVAPPGAPPPHPAGDGPQARGEPPIEDVEVTDLLLVVDLKDEVLVVDEHPRYHVAGCARLRGQTTIPLPLDEARIDGFTPCGVCAPDRNLADRERARRAGRTS